MAEAVLEVAGLSAGYGDAVIVEGLSFALPPGSITTVIGGNGAGKSTLLRAIYGTARHRAGSLRFKARAIEALPPWQRMALGIGFVPQGRCNFPAMSVAENLKLGCYRLPRARHAQAIDRVATLFPLLRATWRRPAGNLSGGEQQILEMAMVLESEPALLMLDEPSLGLSPKLQAEVFETVAQIAPTGVTILMVEQNVHGALMISDTAIVMELGRKFLEGPAAEVQDDPRIARAYLGGAPDEAAAAR